MLFTSLYVAEKRAQIDRDRCQRMDCVLTGLPDPAQAAMAKCFANRITREVCAVAMQLMGGYGYAREFGMERRLRDSYGWGIAGGSIDIRKVNIAAALTGHRSSKRR